MARLTIILDLPEADDSRIDATDAADLVTVGSLPRFVPGGPFTTDEVEMLTSNGWRDLAGTFVSAEWSDGTPGEAQAVIADELRDITPRRSITARRILEALAAHGFRVHPAGDR